MHKVCSEIYATRWCYNLWCANGPGSLGNVLLAPQPRFRDLALPSIKYWNQFFHIRTHFNRKSIVNESLRLLWFSKSCPCPASFTLCSRCPNSMLPCFLLFSSNCHFCDRIRSNGNRLFRNISYNDCAVYKSFEQF